MGKSGVVVVEGESFEDGLRRKWRPAHCLTRHFQPRRTVQSTHHTLRCSVGVWANQKYRSNNWNEQRRRCRDDSDDCRGQWRGLSDMVDNMGDGREKRERMVRFALFRRSQCGCGQFNRIGTLEIQATGCLFSRQSASTPACSAVKDEIWANGSMQPPDSRLHNAR